MFRHRFAVLLASLVLLLLAAPAVRFIAAPYQVPVAHMAITAVFAMALLAALFAVSTSRTMVLLAVSLAVPAILLQGIDPIFTGEGTLIAEYVVSMVFLALTMTVVLRAIFTSRRVTVDTICASLCVYLLMGVFWAMAYSLLDILEPGASFHFALESDSDESLMRFGAERSIFPLYYSLVTITTLGYGDVVPNSPSARMLAAIEAVLGQIYLAVLVARLVGLHISHSVGKRRRSEGED